MTGPRAEGRTQTVPRRPLGEVAAWAMTPTPFTSDGSRVDTDSLARFARHATEQGCTGFLALGVIAEPATLSLQERLTCLATVADAAPSSPVVATVMELDTGAAVQEAEILTRSLGAGVAGLMVPVTDPDADVLRAHLRAVHDATGCQVVVQDLPRATGVQIAVDDLACAVDGLDFVAGVKCESPPTFVRVARLRDLTGVPCISGFGGIGLVDDVVSGATSVAVGVTPAATVVAALDAARLGRHAEAARLIGTRAALITYETQPGQSIAIRKEHWRRAGVIAHRSTRAPTPAWTDDLDDHSRAHGVGELTTD
ncbi:dihydrodipicolinate synthase family protein [Aeromicrobium endophyticum]|uniref:Dihydrodipicolinate synthase family protein n=1 Tax=Aeromicrobium endophyticum TaxID=2292704 RepID=A0A371PAW2_9ACTN|nr:dihydrodipicolinate synthase family protein [Aeromicrobium endophyticum]REK73083.1 dihydrodipicolinate synthase family protein [Aeromicrobium endophyticum]